MQTGRHARQVRLKTRRTSAVSGTATKRHLEEDSVKTDQIRTQARKEGKIDLQKISIDSSSIAAKKGAMKQDMTDSGRFQARRFMSQRIRRDCRSQLGPVPQMSMTVRNSLTCWKTFQNWQVIIWDVRLSLHMQVRGYDAKCIRDYLRCHGIDCCIPYKRNSKKIAQNRNQNITARQDLSRSGSLHGSSAGFTGRQ